MTAQSLPDESGVLDLHVRRHRVDARLRLSMDDAPVTVLFGPSGAGKTTILRCVAGLDHTEQGHLRFECVGWDDGRSKPVPPRRRQVGFLFQDHALFPHLSVEANVGYGLGRMSRADRRRRVTSALETAHALSCVGRPVLQLSGGEAQRVALARALASGPRLLLLDEPLSALDAPTRTRLRGELRRMLKGSGVPALVVTHDRDEALALGDRVVVVIDGTVRQVGPPVEVFDRPADAEVAAVVGVETVAEGKVLARDAGLVRVQVGDAQLTALADEASTGTGDAVLVCIRAEDVALEAPRGPSTLRSARNQLSARVTSVSPSGPLVRVDLDAGFGLTAYITRPALEELELSLGSPVLAVIKSPAVHLISRDSAPDDAGAGHVTPPKG